jgi:rod shape determining protein RodA
LIDRRLIQNFDWFLLLFAVAITAVGIVSLYSAAYQAHSGTGQGAVYNKQIFWLGAGVLALIAMMIPDYRTFERFAYPIYWMGVALLVAVLFVGTIAKGSQRWLAFGPITIQPSELVKLAVVIALARFFHRNRSASGYGLLDLVRPLLIIGIPFLLVLKQPDLGTAMLVALIGGTALVFVNVRLKSVLTMAGAGLGTAFVAWKYLLHDYQRMRVKTFLDPEMDPLNSGYQAIQSKIAVGSGGLFGKGFLHGTQTQLNFLPEQQTDFIFSVTAEEWGFLGAGLVLLLYLVLILYSLNVARSSKDGFGALLGAGIAAMLFWPVFVNVGMVLGFLPVVGVPLPLMSYGGSSLVVTYAALGLLMNIRMRRFTF